MKKIIIVGPESTGKSTLTQQLAKHFNCDFIPEYAIEYISKLEREYEEDDILAIAKKQYELQKEYFSKNDFVFIDTDLIVCKIWSQFKYGRCNPWILEQLSNTQDCYYLVCDIDLPWQKDKQREHPYQRDEIFQLYLSEMREKNYQFSIVSGLKNERLQSAVNIVNSL
jgi:nicotinamide riboside kinase